MTVLEAAAKALEESGHPLPVSELTKAMILKGYWSTQGLTPVATVQARLAMDIKNADSQFFRSSPGHYGLKGQVEALQTTASSGTPQALFQDNEEEEGDLTQTSSSLTFTDAAELVLQEAGRRMHYREITEAAKKFLKTRGKTPEATMYAQILTEIARYQKRGLTPRFQKFGNGVVGLSELDETSATPAKTLWSEKDAALLSLIKTISSKQFEKLASILLGVYFNADLPVTQPQNDRGIDAFGKVRFNDLFEIEMIVQAKKYTTQNVQRPDIQKLRGSMKANSIAVFITTAGFSRGAITEASRENATHPISLVDGRKCVDLMKECGVDIDSNGDPALTDKGEKIG